MQDIIMLPIKLPNKNHVFLSQTLTILKILIFNLTKSQLINR